MGPLLAVTFGISIQGLEAADGPIAAVQEALKKEHFLIGEPSGVLDDSTRVGLRRFQLRSGLPATGEIDTATLLALQGIAAAAQRSPLAPPADPGPARAIVQKDHEFLKKVEAGRDQPIPQFQTSAPTMAPSAPVSAPAPPQAVEPAAPGEPAPPADLPATPISDTADERLDLKRKSESPKSLPAEKPRQATTRKADREPPTRRKIESESVADARTTATPMAESDDDPDVLGPHGLKVTRTTTTVGPDGRTYVSETTMTTRGGTPIPVRRAEPVEPQPRGRVSFFHRIFGGQ